MLPIIIKELKFSDQRYEQIKKLTEFIFCCRSYWAIFATQTTKQRKCTI